MPAFIEPSDGLGKLLRRCTESEIGVRDFKMAAAFLHLRPQVAQEEGRRGGFLFPCFLQ